MKKSARRSTLTEWAKTHPWKAAPAPYLAAIMDTVTDPAVKTVAIRAPNATRKSTSNPEKESKR